jgi:hypothetical protein
MAMVSCSWISLIVCTCLGFCGSIEYFSLSIELLPLSFEVEICSFSFAIYYLAFSFMSTNFNVNLVLPLAFLFCIYQLGGQLLNSGCIDWRYPHIPRLSPLFRFSRDMGMMKEDGSILTFDISMG